MVTLVMPLSQVGKEHESQVGGKAANLGELMRAEAQVPTGIVVTAEGFQCYMDETPVGATLQKFTEAIDFSDMERAHFIAGRCQQVIKGTPLPTKVELAVRGLSSDSSLLQGTVAVRSSAIGEDGDTTSFAGQHSTYLGVNSTDLMIRRIRDCYASLFEPRALAYRIRNGIPLMGMQMAVVIQQMANPKISGVLFTGDPQTGEDHSIIEAVWGLGEGLVSGKYTPDHYRVDNGTMEELKRIEAYQNKYLMHDYAGSMIELNCDQSAKLESAEVRFLVSEGQRLQEYYGMPLDIEWVFNDGVFTIVQARSITTMGKIEQHSSVEVSRPVLVKGLATSYGQATGKVRLVLTKSDLAKVKDGDILVTKMTTPDYIPVFNKIAGMITDHGGTTCHAAIVSREYGLPCVVGTGNATAMLKGVKEVMVDGGQGYVYRGE